ncbi:NAD(P)-binding domain protein [Pleurostoma richardsiae]|uniref:NAD(P)-binding domain protein n=1 Tax=Pleurostoma richardsiae TaxID=41990 RepID=A0AA38RXC9_9PEZI|nr:NAD(P)-binding domain protein [Pleurostoma richardsiae]
MSDSHASKGGEFQTVPQKAQSQNLPGLEKDMKPSSEPTKLEGEDQAYEYVPAGKLKGCKALITGGDSGIGRAVAVLYAREGADVSIVYLPEEQPDAEDTKKLVEKEGRKCLLIAGNLEDYNTCKDAVQKHVDAFGIIHVLVNNASKQMMCDDFADIDLGQVESVFRSNIIQMFAMTKYALPHMKKGGSIINTTSTVAFRGTGSMVDYAATKGAIASFTRALAKNLLPKGIRVNAVAPGPVHTPLQPASRPAEQMEKFGEGSALGRPGQPSEVAPSFVFLASKDSELYYGQFLHAYPLGD